MKDKPDYEFVIDENPFGKERPRTVRNSGRMYTPPKTAAYEAKVRAVCTQGVDEVIEGPVRIDITAVFPVPKSYSKKRREKCLSGEEYPTKKPDKDNIDKVIYDGLNPRMRTNKATHKKVVVNRGLYLDDKQVVDGRTSKVYGEKGCVKIQVYKL